MASDGCGSDLGGASWKLSSRTIRQPLEALYRTTLPFSSCARWPKCRRVWSAIVVALACVTGSAKSASMERSALAEMLCRSPTASRRCLDPGVVFSIAVPIASTCDRTPGPASRLRVSSSRAPVGPSATRTKVPCCHPGLVVSSSTATVVAGWQHEQCYYSSSCVALLFSVASSRPLVHHQTYPIPLFVHDSALPVYDLSSASTVTPLGPAATPPLESSVFTSRPLGTAPANHSTLSKSRAGDRRHQSRHPATTTINQDNHDKIKIYRRQSAEE